MFEELRTTIVDMIQDFLTGDLLFEAIRKDLPYNETERSCNAAMAGILGRMAAESGQMIRWDEAMASDLELAPGLDDLTLESEAPVKPVAWLSSTISSDQASDGMS